MYAQVAATHYLSKLNQTATLRIKAHIVHPHLGAYQMMSSYAAVVTTTGKSLFIRQTFDTSQLTSS
jgi:hypothetical protein